MCLPRQKYALKRGGRRVSASTSTKMFQKAGNEERKDKRGVDTLLCDVVSRLRQWEGVEGRRGGGEPDVVGSKFGLSQIPPVAPLTKVYLPC
jgi:hypothetical protein